jgi:hypothetical protein
MRVINDPDLYRELAVPFGDVEDANVALEDFYEELREIRAKYKIADVYVVVAVRAILEDGTEGEFMSNSMNGNSLKALPMVAWAFGKEKADFSARIDHAVKGGE